MNYTVEGKSHTKLLVFINGAGLCKWMWRFQKSLSEKYKCIFFDLPGHGDNIKFKFTTINEISANLLEIIRNESNEKKAVIIGHSIGAQIALNILKIHSEYISKAVIISALNNPTKLTPFFIKPMISISMPLVKQKWIQ
jgi:pimeloyl-ACP methyl ester carboxylesterase